VVVFEDTPRASSPARAISWTIRCDRQIKPLLGHRRRTLPRSLWGEQDSCRRVPTLEVKPHDSFAHEIADPSSVTNSDTMIFSTAAPWRLASIYRIRRHRAERGTEKSRRLGNPERARVASWPRAPEAGARDRAGHAGAAVGRRPAPREGFSALDW